MILWNGMAMMASCVNYMVEGLVAYKHVLSCTYGMGFVYCFLMALFLFSRVYYALSPLIYLAPGDLANSSGRKITA